MEKAETVLRIIEILAQFVVGVMIYRATINAPSRAVQDQKKQRTRGNSKTQVDTCCAPSILVQFHYTNGTVYGYKITKG
jgi:hypothetical protein